MIYFKIIVMARAMDGHPRVWSGGVYDYHDSWELAEIKYWQQQLFVLTKHQYILIENDSGEYKINDWFVGASM